MRRVLLILCMILLVLIGLQWLDWPKTHERELGVTAATSDTDKRETPPPEPPLLGAPVTAYGEIFEHSLFRADRSGFHAEPELDAAASAPTNPPQFRLLGVILTGSEPSAAMILEPQKTKSRLIHVGDQVGAWELEQIAVDHVVMTAHEQRQSVPLRPY
jgi:hypothetical protein